MKQFDLYVPLYTGQGKRLPRKQLNWLKRLLIDRFGGLTYFPQANKGFWRVGDVTFRDELIIFCVLCENRKSNLLFWRGLKRELETKWKQQEILILVRSIKVL